MEGVGRCGERLTWFLVMDVGVERSDEGEGH